jgi:hypothetical protein
MMLMVFDVLYRLGKYIDLLIGLLLADAVYLLQFAGEYFPFASNIINIVFCQTPPVIENHTLKLHPMILYQSPFHGFLLSVRRFVCSCRDDQ